LKASRPGETFFYSKEYGEIEHGCRVEQFDLTAHADREELLDFVERVEPRQIILGHGDEESRTWFASAIAERYPGVGVCQPGPGEAVEF